MLADASVVAMAEAADGRMVIGLEDRGVILLTLPEGWLNRPPEFPSASVPWESRRPHEPSYQDASVVLHECQDKSGGVPASLANSLVADLRGRGKTAESHFRVVREVVFEGHPDIVVRGRDADKLLAEVTPILGKYGSKARFSVWKRQGARGSTSTQVKMCP